MITMEEQLDEQAHYHFTLCDLVDYMERYGFDHVFDDVTAYYHKRMFDRLHESEF